MPTDPSAPRTMDEYIAGFPKEIQEILQEIRKTIRKAAPAAKETIKYKMPTYTLNGNLIYFAAFKNHIALYPAPKGTAKFNKELAAYRGAKSSVRFPLDKPIPFDLVSQIVKLRVKDNLQRAKAKGEKK